MKKKPVLLIDNTSPVSCSFMRFIINSGGLDVFSFLSIRSEEGKVLMAQHEVTNSERKVLILLEDGKIFTDTIAFIKSASKISGFIPLVYWYAYMPGKSLNKCMS